MRRSPIRRMPFFVALSITFVIEILLGWRYIGTSKALIQDTVAFNDCRITIQKNWGEAEAYPKTPDYTVLNPKGEVLFQTRKGIATSENEAIRNSDAILPLVVGEEQVGTLLIHNRTIELLNQNRRNLRTVLVVFSAIQLGLIVLYFLYLKKTIIDPFAKLQGFAARVAEGNLDLPLSLDRRHIFGSFTEAFDLMRSELKKARLAEKRANDEKKEMVAKLSHDIKTPVASIKSTSEVGMVLNGEGRIGEMFGQINEKSDQITTLVDNLFNSSISEITEIAVTPGSHPSDVLEAALRRADYLNKATIPAIPKCNLYCDKLRLQQALDNLFMNSYKYANTEIVVETTLQEDFLTVRIADSGAGVLEEELPLLTEKYRRGSNTAEKEGAGLGLFLTKYYLENMDGRLELRNANPGLAAILYLRRI